METALSPYLGQAGDKAGQLDWNGLNARPMDASSQMLSIRNTCVMLPRSPRLDIHLHATSPTLP